VDPTPTSSFLKTMGAEPPRKRRRWPLVAALLGVVAVYLGAAFFLADRVPEGTTVDGVAVGSSESQARAALTAYAATSEATPITVTAGDEVTTVDPEGSLAVDVESTLDEITGFTLAPTQLWARISGSEADVEPVVDVNEASLETAVEGAAQELNSEQVDASVSIEGGEAVVHPGAQSIVVDTEATAERIEGAWPTDQVEAVAEVEDPAITTDQAEALAAGLNGHAFAGATVLTGPNGDVTITGEQLAAYSDVVDEGGTLVWRVDGAALAEAIEDAHPKINNKAVSAAFKFDRRHQLTVTEGVPGRKIDADTLGSVIEAAVGTTGRTAELPYVETKPKVTAEDLPAQDFTTRVSQFRTPLTPEPIRTRNLVRAAELVTGTVVKPGERFDLTKTLEPISAANGFYEAHVIVNGRLTNGMGGGLSQMATTTFNAGYFAGMKDITHRPHSVWFTRYPAGRESTIVTGSINVIFENTTPYALMMSSYVSGGYLYVDIWSTPYYRVETSASPKTNVVQPSWVTYDDDKCEPKSKGQPGFTITNTRKVYLGDELVDTNRFTWTYRPDHGVRCD